jgi:hypothetical protein
MKTENKETLDRHYHHWKTLRDAQYLRGLNVHERADMLRILREEFWPGYTYDEWCSSCVTQMVTHLYQRYDKWLSEQPVVVAATFPVNNKPIITLREPTPEEEKAIMDGLNQLAQSISESGKQLTEHKPPNKKHRRK